MIIGIFHIAGVSNVLGLNPVWTRAMGSPLLPRLPPTVQRATFMVVCVDSSGVHRWKVQVSKGFYMEWIKKGMFSWCLKKKNSCFTSAGTSRMRRLLQWSPHSSIISQPRGRKQRDEKDQWERNCCFEYAEKETFHISLIDVLCFDEAN